MQVGFSFSPGIFVIAEAFSPLDIYCYICNDSQQDPELATHLSTFGISIQTLKKTEKSMTELVSA